MNPERTPWAVWLRCAMGLGVPPHRFWALSLREWRALTGASSLDALRIAELQGLMARFPDETS